MKNTVDSKEWWSDRGTGSGKRFGVGWWYTPPGGAGFTAKRRRRGSNTALAR